MAAVSAIVGAGAGATRGPEADAQPVVITAAVRIIAMSLRISLSRRT
jgi:hypothetical protein